MDSKDSISLAMLSEELERQTQETQKLEEEVEQATRLTLENMAHAFSNIETSGNHVSTNHESEESSEIGACIPPVNYDVDVKRVSCLNFQGRDLLEHALEDYPQQVSELQKQSREMYELHGEQMLHFCQTIIKLENKLYESQAEKDTLTNLRLKDSQKHAQLLEQLQSAQLELHMLKQTEGHKLMEAEDRANTLNRKAEMMAQMLQDTFSRLSDYEKRSGKSTCLCQDRAFSPRQFPLGPAVEKALQELENENHALQEKLQMMETQLKDLKEQSQEKAEFLQQEHKESMELITSYEQKVVVMTEKLNSSQTNADGLQHQVEVLQQQLQIQTSLHQSEMSDMESILSMLRSELLEKQKSHSATEQSREVRRLQALLDEQDAELSMKQQEVQRGRAQLDEKRTQVQALLAEVELLKLRLEEGKKSDKLHMRPLMSLQQEKKNLIKQLEQLRLDNQQLRAALLEAEQRLRAMEQERTQQQAALSERTSSLHQLTVEKQQVTADLESQCKKLDQLIEEQKALREEHSKKTEELKRQNSKLKAQCNKIRNDLEQATSTLKTLEGADEHGLKVAFGIQKQITAKRQQVDLLQSRVQMLEETTERLTQEKNYEVMKNKGQAQEMLFERDRRKRLETELEAHRESERRVKSETERLNNALHKMSDSFAECQDYIQKQQQEIMRLKLQHTLELKEGQNLRAISARNSESGQDINCKNKIHRSPEVPFQAHSASQLNISKQKCSPVLELRSLVKEIHSVIDMEQNLDNSSRGFEETHRSRKEVVTENRRDERKTGHSGQDPVRVPNFNKQDMNSAFSANQIDEAGLRAGWPCDTSFGIAVLGRRSPVHSLLTSDLPTKNHSSLRRQNSAFIVQTSVIKQAEITEQTCKKQSKPESLQKKAEGCQIKNQEKSLMIKSQEKMRRRMKERKLLKNYKLLDQNEDKRTNFQSK